MLIIRKRRPPTARGERLGRHPCFFSALSGRPIIEDMTTLAPESLSETIAPGAPEVIVGRGHVPWVYRLVVARVRKLEAQFSGHSEGQLRRQFDPIRAALRDGASPDKFLPTIFAMVS